MNKIKFIIIFTLLVILHTSHLKATIISLNSSNTQIEWQVKPQADLNFTGYQISMPEFQMSNYVKGVVPGVVFTAYVEAGLEKDPNYADNIYQVDEAFYNRPFWYRTEFELPKTINEEEHVWLHFDGTNKFADFYFNGKKLSGTPLSTKDIDGHMIRTKYNVTNLLNKSGKNVIAVLITDANQKKTRKSKESFGISSSPTYLASAGWDWMPYVPGRLAGITGNVYVKITGKVIMEDPWIRSDLPSLNNAEITILADMRNVSSKSQTAVLSGVIQPGNIRFSKEIILGVDETTKITINKDDFSSLIINNPKLWWPNGYGDPNLYTCKLKCVVDGIISDIRDITFGIKKYEYKMQNNIAGWPVLIFYINNQKIFLKGGNWGMSEYLLRCQEEEYETKILLHKDMNYNMIRLWTGCVTDDAFYNYCDKHGIMVWDDFWLYVAYNEVEQPESFKLNARDKVRRLRNHPSIAIWCGANETRPSPDLDNYLREMIAVEDNNDRMYKSSSNQDGLSGSGWWGNQPPKHHFEHSGSNLAWNDPPYPYGSDRGYGLRTEIGTATFPNYESVIEFIPNEEQWPLPTDQQLKDDEGNVWNKHFFGKEALNANPLNYKTAVDSQFGESLSLREFCEKAQLLNIEVMKGMYEAWNDKMWYDASGILIWMSQSAYPSFVWQTYDYYYDATGSYWGAKKGCEHLHIQWNSSNNQIKAVNTTSKDLIGATATATIYDTNGIEVPEYGKSKKIDVLSSNTTNAFTLNFNPNNLSFNKKATASSCTKLNDAFLAVDGGAGSRWESEYSDPQWICVDLEKKKQIETIVLKWEVAHAKEYEIQVSNDAISWRTIHVENSSKGGTEKITLKPIKARYVKLLCKSRATTFGYSLYEIEIYGKKYTDEKLSPLHFIRLELTDSNNKSISNNFYWRNGVKEQDFKPLNDLPEADLTYKVIKTNSNNRKKSLDILVNNNSNVIGFANRLRLVNSITQERILPLILNDNYFTLMPNEEKVISIEFDSDKTEIDVGILVKQYKKEEKKVLSIKL